MSLAGFDLGNESSIMAVAGQRGIDVVLNDQFNRETPAIVCFGAKQRFIGTAGAAASTMMNMKNSISQIKRFLGRQFNDPELQRDIDSLPFSVIEGPGGYPLIHVQYLGESRTFTPTEILGMVLSNLKRIAEKNLKRIVDCCIGIPVYFTDLQRRAVLDAAKIAGLNPLGLIHETTATALSYGIYNNTDLPENDQLNVAFVDVGHASMQVCIAAFKKGQLKILAHSFDRSLGGRDFDEVLFQHFGKKFNEDHNSDVFQNPRACFKLRAAVEKLKKVLSANTEAPLNVECLMDEKDVRGFITRKEFEQISAPILERVERPLEKALEDARLTIDDVHVVEVVGSGSRVPAIIEKLNEFFKKKPRRTMNEGECVARGCAEKCAILSPTFEAQEFQVCERFPFPIALSWKDAASDNQQNTIVLPKGNLIPSVKAFTFDRSRTFSFDVKYADVNELQSPAKISTYTIGSFQSTKSELAEVKVKVALNQHGIVSVGPATLSPVEPKKNLTNVTVTEVVYGGMLAADVEKALEEEKKMASQDQVMEETKDRKNAVEAYVYDMRNKLSDKYKDVVTASENKELSDKLQKVEDWLYGDGKDETKEVYVFKLEELKKQGGPIEERYKEYVNRGAVIDQLIRCINSYREAAVSNGPEKQKVLKEAEAWLREKKQQHPLTSAEVDYLLTTLAGFLLDASQSEVNLRAEVARLQHRERTLESDATEATRMMQDQYRQQARTGAYSGDGVTYSDLGVVPGSGEVPHHPKQQPLWAEGQVEHTEEQTQHSEPGLVSNGPRFDHIDVSEKQKVLKECEEAEAWSREKKQQQASLPKDANPVLSSSDVSKKTEAVEGFCSPIIMKPRPALTQPAAFETPLSSPPQGNELQLQGGSAKPVHKSHQTWRFSGMIRRLKNKICNLLQTIIKRVNCHFF